LLERCIAILRSEVDYPRFDLIVADNAPGTSGAAEICERHGVRRAEVPERGLSRARNAGALCARSEVVCFLDDDMVPDRNWLAALVEPFLDERVALVAGCVVPMDLRGKPPREISEWIEDWRMGLAPFHIDRSSPQWFERTGFGGVCQGAIAVRREAFADWGGFDENLGRGCIIDHAEESYAALSLVHAGYRVAYTPQSIVFHQDPEVTLDSRLYNIRQASAYMCYLAARHPQFAPRIAKYCVEGGFGAKRPWRGRKSVAQAPARIPRLRAILSFLGGTSIYWRARREMQSAPPRSKA
jgi:GT2 family glycosyltransferase